MSTDRKLLICAISDPMRNDSCLMFAISMLKLQGLLARVKGLMVNISFVNNESVALDAFSKSDYDCMIVMSTMMGFDPEMVLKMITTDKEFVVGVYPLPGINFEHVKTKTSEGSAEDVKNQGLTYNCSVAGLDLKARYAKVKVIKDMKLYKVTKKTIQGIDSPITADKLLEAWKGPIFGDIEYQCSSFGPQDFVGCVGLRKTLR